MPVTELTPLVPICTIRARPLTVLRPASAPKAASLPRSIRGAAVMQVRGWGGGGWEWRTSTAKVKEMMFAHTRMEGTRVKGARSQGVRSVRTP